MINNEIIRRVIVVLALWITAVLLIKIHAIEIGTQMKEVLSESKQIESKTDTLIKVINSQNEIQKAILSLKSDVDSLKSAK